jgi:hypothetical protein
MKTAIVTTVRFLLLVVIFIVLFTVANGFALPPGTGSDFTPEQLQQTAIMFPFVCLLMVAVLTYVTLRSHWHGWKLAGALFAILYGVYAFLSQIESAVFVGTASRMPPGMLGGLFGAGVLLALPFSLLAVWILGKTKQHPAAGAPNDRLIMPAAEWAWKLTAIVVLYEVIYFGFGYFVAWRTPGLPEFYGGTDPGTFFGQLGNVMRDTPWLPLFQVPRALMWTGIACLIIRMHNGGVLETSLAVGLTFAVLMGTLLLIPNPVMTEAVARGHLYEVLSSNLLFGSLLSRLLLWKRK